MTIHRAGLRFATGSALLLLFALSDLARAQTTEKWGVPIYPGAVLKAETKRGEWSVAQYQTKEKAAKVLDFYSARYSEPVLEGGKWRYDIQDPALEFEVAEITLGPDAGLVYFFVRHRGSQATPAAGRTAVPSGTELWGVPIYPGATRRGRLEAGAKTYVTFSTPAGLDRVVEFYSPKYGKAADLPPTRKLIKATKQGVEITISPVSEGGVEITLASTKPLID